MTHHERCYLCNKVSSQDIETNIGDFTKKKFFRESESSLAHLVLCEECKASIEDQMLDYELEHDDIYGWLRGDNDNHKDIFDEFSDFEEMEEAQEDSWEYPD